MIRSISPRLATWARRSLTDIMEASRGAAGDTGSLVVDLARLEPRSRALPFVLIIDTDGEAWHFGGMAQRQTMNVSLPEAQEQFVRAQVSTGRYRTASEVVRDGLRMLEQAEHRRLLEKWIYEDLSDEELELLPEELKQRTRAYFQGLIDEGLRSAEEHGWVDGPKAMERIRAKLSGNQRGTS